MYIQPDGVIQLYKDIPMSPDYENTLYFENTTAKDDYFTNLNTKFLTQCQPLTYTREHRGFVRVNIPIDMAYKCNYMRYKNTSFKNKWFYAFVTNVEYINNSCVQLNFEIDYIMTWMGEFQLAQCFIERQHTLHDGIGNNIAEEGLSVGEYINEGVDNLGGNEFLIAIVFANPKGSGTGGGTSGGIYNACKIYLFDRAGDANYFIATQVDANLGDNIVGMYMAPAEFAPPLADDHSIVGSVSPHVETYEIEKPYTDIDGYVPRNKKLFCYPYKYLVVDNNEGSTQEYMYEYFNDLPDRTSTGECYFDVIGTVGATSELTLVPKDYKDAYSSGARNYEERIGVSNFPQCAWMIDSYRAYVAQINANLPLDTAQNALQSGLSSYISAKGGLFGTGVTGVDEFAGGALYGAGATIANALLVNSIRPTRPTISRGSQTVNNLAMVSAGRFKCYKKCITRNYAMMLDDYFDMFGYAVKQVGVPNMNARPNWTYVKTIGCITHGELPAEHSKRIEQIFDKGVRFWKNVTDFGNYNLPNAPA